MGQPDEFARLVESIVTNPYLNGENISTDGALRLPDPSRPYPWWPVPHRPADRQHAAALPGRRPHITAPDSFSWAMVSHSYPSSSSRVSVCSPCSGACTSAAGVSSNCTGLPTRENDPPSSSETTGR